MFDKFHQAISIRSTLTALSLSLRYLVSLGNVQRRTREAFNAREISLESVVRQEEENVISLFLHRREQL